MGLFANDEAKNQELRAETPFIFVVIGPPVKLLKNERKALKTIWGGLVLIDDICPDNAAARGFLAFDDLTIKWVLRSADWIVICPTTPAFCPTDDPLSERYIPEPIRVAAIKRNKVAFIATTDAHYEDWVERTKHWHKPGANLWFLIFPKEGELIFPKGTI